jgi:hypothetical protein
MRAATLGIALLLSLVHAKAVIMTYSFFQDGFHDGAFISGSFTVQDLNGDGVFAGANPVGPAETLSYGASFSGNSIVPAFGGVSGLGIFGFLYNPMTNDFCHEYRVSYPRTFSGHPDNSRLGFGHLQRDFWPALLSDTSTAPVVITLKAVNGIPVSVPENRCYLASLAPLSRHSR